MVVVLPTVAAGALSPNFAVGILSPGRPRGSSVSFCAVATDAFSAVALGRSCGSWVTSAAALDEAAAALDDVAAPEIKAK